MTVIQTILPRLKGLHETKNGWSVCCPAHDDSRRPPHSRGRERLSSLSSAGLNPPFPALTIAL